jgi:Ser/Thr protein kinase RdoA (MazF antagonist)
VRRLPDRENLRFHLDAPAGRALLHAKRHRSPREGPRELEWHRRLAALGVPVPAPAAAGPGFFASETLPGAVPLDDALRRGLPAAEKRRLARALAALARRLHDARLCHRDLYLNHVLLTPDGRLHLIDLQRVRRFRLERWRVKDLAALRASSALPGVTRADRLRFLVAYAGGRPAPRLCRRVERRAARVLRRIRRPL